MYYKYFSIIIYDCNDNMIVIYDYNDSGLYYKITIVTCLALARNINYDRKNVIYNFNQCYNKLKHNLRLYKTFVVLATRVCSIKLFTAVK